MAGVNCHDHDCGDEDCGLAFSMHKHIDMSRVSSSITLHTMSTGLHKQLLRKQVA